MNEIRRTDSLNLDVYINYLHKNGMTPKKSTLRSCGSKFRNVAGMNTKDIPAICDNNIHLQKEV